MPKPRKALVSLEATPYYHCVARCVRRAFLCGEDAASGSSFEHRRGWIRERLFQLSQVFALDVCAYAVMSNHYHLVLHVDREAAMEWDSSEVLRRWHALFSGNELTRRFERGETLLPAELRVVDTFAELWRSRLADISWFMRCLNEEIARKANEEDNCTGRFWEGRFKSQALLDEKALAACLAYVDLNPVRAQMAQTPEASEFTSVQERAAAAKLAEYPDKTPLQPARLLPFAGNPREPMPKGLPFRLTDYLDLVDFTGRLIREGKRGAIPEHLPSILRRLAIDPKQWGYLTTQFESPFKGLVGAADRLKQACQQLGYRRTPGIGASRTLLA
ncbi:transposase [Thiohalomonas denitrificans]|uniref:transposase n=1 Tax=Thiohalomonas denitrificans TaxID=415747 RepID=UPI0026EEE75B|nr:transposase [Thiohalomonas denitrificans]